MTKLKAQARENKNTKQVRKDGGIPAVLYGHKIKNVNLTLDGRSFPKLYKEAGASTVVDLHIDGETAERNVIIHDVSYEPVVGTIVHVDLYEVKKGEKVKVSIPLVFVGESAAVKADGGVLVKNIYKVEIEALPKDLPHEITVDIAKLATFSDAITIGDLDVPAGVHVHGDAGEVIAKVMPPRTTEELEALEKAVELKVEDVKVESEEKKKERDAEKAATEEK